MKDLDGEETALFSYRQGINKKLKKGYGSIEGGRFYAELCDEVSIDHMAVKEEVRKLFGEATPLGHREYTFLEQDGSTARIGTSIQYGYGPVDNAHETVREKYGYLLEEVEVLEGYRSFYEDRRRAIAEQKEKNREAT